MTNFRKSVPSPGAGAGAAKAKKGNITVIFADDVLPGSWPLRDDNKVKMIGNIVLKPGAKMHILFTVSTSQKMTDEITGDEGFESFDKKAEGIHPGNSLEIREFRANTLGVGLILIFGEGCGEKSGDVIGSPCNPAYLRGSYSNDNEGVKNTMMFEVLIKDSTPIGKYDGEITLTENYIASDESLDLTKANGVVQQLPAFTADEAITAATTDLNHGTIVSLIGGGGSGPGTLSPGTHPAYDVILKDNTPWVALNKAVIHLEVYKAAPDIYLIERSRA